MHSGETDRDLTKFHDQPSMWLEAEHVKLDNRDSTDDEEVRLLPHMRGMDEPDPPGSDIRYGPNTSDTQRDEWLLKTEPLQGARPKCNIGERPPVVNDQTGVLDLEATGGVGDRNVEQHGNPAPLLPLEWQILQEAEVTTPPRGGGGAHGPGDRPAPEPQVPPGGARAVPQIFTDVRSRDISSDRRNDAWSPAMCWLTRLLGCNRTWRTSELRTGCCEHRGSSGSAHPSTGGVHNDESNTVWWDDQLGTVPTGF